MFVNNVDQSGDWHVIMGVRNPDKAEAVAEEYGFPKDSYSIEPVELESFESVRKFASRLRSGRQVDSLVCNAALYLPASPEASYTVEVCMCVCVCECVCLVCA